MLRRLLPLFLGSALFAAACAGQGPTVASEDGSVPSETSTPLPTPLDQPPDSEAAEEPQDLAPPNPAEGATPGARIAVQTSEGQLFTVLPDGSDPLPLGDPNHSNSRPTWSPDASFIAWASVDSSSGASALAASRFDGAADHRAASVGPVTAISWDPSSATVAYLAGVPTGQQLTVVGITEPTVATALDTGSPYWFTWAPADEELLVHADGFRLDRISIEGEIVTLSEGTGSFQNPVWVDTERALLFTDGGADNNSLISTGAEGEGRLELLTYTGYLHLIANPDANRVAVQVSEAPPDIAEIITASVGQIDPGLSIDLDAGQLFIVAVFGGSPASVGRLPALAFAWSADGATLAYLVQVTSGTNPWYEWRFLADGSTTTGPLHQLTDTFSDDFLPYFDQVANDVTFFSPDGSQFVFSGRTLGGDEGIWTHTIGAGLTPDRVADGVFATWSPGPAGGGARSIL